MLKRKVTKTLVLFLVFSVIISTNFFGLFNQKGKVSDEKTQEQKIAEAIAIENQRKLDEQILKEKIVKANNFIKNVSNEIEILLLSENGEHTIFHDRTPENNWYSEWLNNAQLTIKLDYRTIFSIKTKDIDFNVTPKGSVDVNYDASKIDITAIDISNVLPEQKVSIFGQEYKPTEVTALENIAKQEIKEETYNNANILAASSNLKSYISNLATDFGVDDINITEENLDSYTNK